MDLSRAIIWVMGQFLTGYRKVGPGGAVLLERERLLNGQNAMKVTHTQFLNFIYLFFIKW